MNTDDEGKSKSMQRNNNTSPQQVVADPFRLLFSREIRDEIIDILAASGPTWRKDLQPRTDVKCFSEIFTPERLLPYVRELSVLGCLSPEACGAEGHGSGNNTEGKPDHEWITALVPSLSRFNQIDKLSLHNLSWGDIAVSTRHFILTHFAAVQHLVLSMINFWNSNQLFRTLNSFPQVTRLLLDNTMWHLANHSLQQVVRKEPLKLQCLRFGPFLAGHYGLLIRWLIEERDTVNVDEAEINWGDTDIRSLVDLMRAIAPSLKVLKYQQQFESVGSDHWVFRVYGNEETDDSDDDQASVPDADDPNDWYGIQASDSGGDEDAGEFDDRGATKFNEQNGSEGPEEDVADDANNHNAPSKSLDDDEPTDPRAVWQSSVEVFPCIHEEEANRIGSQLLEEVPIQDSALAIIQGRIVWSTLGTFGIKLLSQLLSPHTRRFTLSLALRKDVRWGQDQADWGTIDALLDSLAPAHNGCLFDLNIKGHLRIAISHKLPRLHERKVWIIRYWQDGELLST
ncbi:predicted protein [Postia placenta Mad-698-R]|nr:predicted protein [Postia placenta Mad-698-R]